MEETIKWLTDWCISSDKENYNMRINEAKEEGIIKSKLEIAKYLINQNCSKEFVLKATKISEEDYNKLINSKSN